MGLLCKDTMPSVDGIDLASLVAKYNWRFPKSYVILTAIDTGLEYMLKRIDHTSTSNQFELVPVPMKAAPVHIIHYRPEKTGMTGFPIPEHFIHSVVFINGLISIEDHDYTIQARKVYPMFELGPTNVLSMLNADKAITRDDLKSLEAVMQECLKATLFTTLEMLL